MRLIDLSVVVCVRPSVCLHEYTTGRNGDALMWKLLHWRRYALWRVPSIVQFSSELMSCW